MARPAAIALLLAAAALPAGGGPARHHAYAESDDRMVFAVVFGHRDTCRVLRRARAPLEPFEMLARRPPRDEPGARLLAEFRFTAGGRPLHMYPTADGTALFAFFNRPADPGVDDEARIRLLGAQHVSERVEFGSVLEDPLAPRPAPADALVEVDAAPPALPGPWTYAFLTRETVPGRLLVMRRSEGPDGAQAELRCFVVTAAEAALRLPERGELRGLLAGAEPLGRAAAAWALGRLGGGEAGTAGRLAAALAQADHPAERAEIALALLRAGDDGARAVPRALLADDASGAALAGARALLRAPPDPDDAAAWAALLGRGDAALEEAAITGLARLGADAVRPVVSLSRDNDPAARRAAARALGWIDAARAEERLLQLARDRDESVIETAAVALTDPPRRLREEHHDDFARALDACRRKGNDRGGRRLSVLAAHAGIRHERVLEALVDLAADQPRAVWALARLTGRPLETAADCRAWWRAR